MCFLQSIVFYALIVTMPTQPNCCTYPISTAYYSLLCLPSAVLTYVLNLYKSPVPTLSVITTPVMPNHAVSIEYPTCDLCRLLLQPIVFYALTMPTQSPLPT